VKNKLIRNLRRYFPSESYKPVTAYFAILSALEMSGQPMDIKYYDFLRAIIQLKQYEPFASKVRTWQTPSELFESKVRERIETLKSGVSLSWKDKLSYAISHPSEIWNSVSTALLGGKPEAMLPTPSPAVDVGSDEAEEPVSTFPQMALPAPNSPNKCVQKLKSAG
jgi:hypothetical protein